MNYVTKYYKVLILLLAIFSIAATGTFTPDIIVTSPDGIWTDTRAYSNLSSAVTAIGANERDVYIVRQETVNALVIPSNVRLHFLKTGSIANAGALTLQTTKIFGDHQIFTGAGAVNFAAGTVVKSSWFSTPLAAISETSNDTVTLLINNSGTISSSLSSGDAVTIRSEAPGNTLTIAAGQQLTIPGGLQCGLWQLFIDQTAANTGVLITGDEIKEAFPEWWGAVGDTSADDTNPINACANAIRDETEHARAKTIVLPSSYKTTDTIDLTGMNVDCRGKIFSYVTDNVQVRVGDGRRLNINLWVDKAGALSWGAGSIGIEVDGLIDSKAFLTARYSETGIKILASNGKATWNNNFSFGNVYQNKVGLLITQAGTGWTNFNRYYGGFFGCIQAGAEAAIKIVRGGPALNKIDSHIFHGIDFEYSTGVNGVVFDDCQHCILHDTRIEGANQQVIAQFNGYAQYNVMNIISNEAAEWSRADFTTGTCTGVGNQINFNNQTKKLLNNPTSLKHAYKMSTYVFVPGFEFIGIALNPGVQASSISAGSIGGDLLITGSRSSFQPKLTISSAGNYVFGHRVDFTGNKKPIKQIEVQASAESLPYYYLLCLDSGGNTLSGASPYYVQGCTVTSIAGYYRVAGNGRIYFHDDVATVYVGVGTATGLTDYALYGFSDNTDAAAFDVMTTFGHPAPLLTPGRYFYSAAPTGWPFGRGEIVYNSAATSGGTVPFGWVQIRSDTQAELTVEANAGNLTVTVDDTTGMTSGDLFFVQLDTNVWHATTINGAPAAGVVTMADAIPVGAHGTVGNKVRFNKWVALANIP